MELTLRQKIGQLVLYSMDGNTITPETRRLMQDYCIGNVIHFGNNVTDFDGSKKLNAELRSLILESCAGVEPFLSIDHEGGRVFRFSQDFTWFPSHLTLSAADDEALSEAVGVDKDGNETAITVKTDKKMVGEALLDEKIVEGDMGDYGLYVKKVNGIVADYDVDQTYWAFYIDGEYAMTGVDVTEIVEGSTYMMKVEK